MEKIYINIIIIYLPLNLKFYKAARRNGNGYSVNMPNSDPSNCDNFNVHKLYTRNVSYILQTLDEGTLWLPKLIFGHIDFCNCVCKPNDNALMTIHQ